MGQLLENELVPQSRTCGARVVHFVNPDCAKLLVRSEPVVFAEVVAGAAREQALEVHVMCPTGSGLYEVERDDTGPVSSETVHALVERIALAHSCRYATICPAEERWPPAWAC